jgi:hypothetical protein
MADTQCRRDAGFRRFQRCDPGGGIIIKLAADKFIVAGEGFHIEFAELKGIPRNSEYLSIEEGTFDGEKWVTKRVLNGDEENTTLLTRQPRILQVRLNRTLK